MKALTFLGPGQYKPVTYVWHDEEKQKRSYETHLFPVAVAKIFNPEKVVVFVTPQAKAHENFAALVQELGDLLEPVDIPEGKSEAELWEIFGRVASAVEKGDTVLLDITHAFRSLPLIVFAVAAYLRRTKNVSIERIIYGAYEAREAFLDTPQPEDRAPIVDLTPLLDLLDWLSGAEFLLRRSDAVLLAELLEQAHRIARTQRPEESSGFLPQHLESLGRQLRNFSQALHLARPRDAMRIASGLLPRLEKATSEVKKWAKPFAVILEQIHSEVSKFSHNNPDVLDKENLQKQLALVEHFVKRQLWMQAVTLAREWVVSWVALQLGGGDWLDKEYREEEIARKGLGAAGQTLQKKSASVPDWFNELPKKDVVAKVWNKLWQLRNDVAHCGMRKGTAGKKMPSIGNKAKEVLNELQELMDDLPGCVLYGGRVVIDLKNLYGEVAKLDELPDYLERVKELAGEGNEVVLTGQAPIWLYLAVAHGLHGKARRLIYDSPVTGEITIFDHTAW